MKLIDIYNSRIEKYAKDYHQLKFSLLKISILRILIFLGTAFCVYRFWYASYLVASIVLVFLVSFIFLIKKNTLYKQKAHKLKVLITINEQEINAIHGDFSSFDNGEIFKEPKHPFAEDIDLFGKNSFFSTLNRTGLIEGRNSLAKKIKSNEYTDILQKQNATKDLANRLDFRQNFLAEAKLLKQKETIRPIIDELIHHHNFIPKSFKYVGILFSLISIVMIGLYTYDIIGNLQLLLWILIGVGITGIYLKKINHLSIHTSKTQDLFRQYQKLFYAIENENFEADLLQQLQQKLSSTEAETSRCIYTLSTYIDNLEQRQNILVGFVLNAMFLWDLQQCYKIEKWLDKNKNHVLKWFDTIAEFDALQSLGNFAFNNPDYTYPIIDCNSTYILKCQEAAHPLIPKNNLVKNDFSIKDKEFLIITGANMAGKSTFLRTISLMIVMANNGIPVCASNCTYYPVKLITSMRTSDSLSEESSYFYAELMRLKFIVDQLPKEKYFIVLDEILKGTNSHDKAKGSQQFVEKLVKSKSTGIIATHDLSLCRLAEELTQVTNHYFDAEIKQGELYFDYTMKEGICQNMNATFLLKKLGIL